MALFRDAVIQLSENKTLNDLTKSMGLKFGARKFVGGVSTDEAISTFKKINADGMSVTFDNLGEFITDTTDAIFEKDLILEMLKAVDEHKLNAHGSVKLTQIGLDIDYDFCRDNFREILEAAKQVGVFINIDMESYRVYDDTMRLFDEMRGEFDNVGTVLQSYLFDSEEDVIKYKDERLRIVKGAYKEDPSVALQERESIDIAFEELIKKHLLEGKGFTSIATHDHNIIYSIMDFVERENIDKSTFEFQMLYGFRYDLAKQIVSKGYAMCIYVPYGNDWYAYFMRRIAERPQNINLLVQDTINNPVVKTGAIVAGALVTVGIISSIINLFKK